MHAIQNTILHKFCFLETNILILTLLDYHFATCIMSTSSSAETTPIQVPCSPSRKAKWLPGKVLCQNSPVIHFCCCQSPSLLHAFHTFFSLTHHWHPIHTPLNSCRRHLRWAGGASWNPRRRRTDSQVLSHVMPSWYPLLLISVMRFSTHDLRFNSEWDWQLHQIRCSCVCPWLRTLKTVFESICVCTRAQTGTQTQTQTLAYSHFCNCMFTCMCIHSHLHTHTLTRLNTPKMYTRIQLGWV